MYVKSKLSPLVYGSAGIYYNKDETEESLLSEIKDYHLMGFDGIKMLDGKVSQYRMTGRKLNAPVLKGMFSYAEKEEIPILMHAADPPEFWGDKSKLSQYAIDKGWYYGDDDSVSIPVLRSWVSDVLSRNPGLKIILAHFYFMADDLEGLSELLDTYKNVCLDLIPGSEMFKSFNENYDESKLFIEKYSDRILYGTDMYDFFPNEERAENEIAGPRVGIVRSMLEKKESFTSSQLQGITIKPFGFEGEILSKTYRDNFTRLYGKAPGKIDAERVLAHCRFIEETKVLAEKEKNNMKTIISYFGKKAF